MIKNGFVTLERKITDWEWYDDINVSRLFIHLILTANYEDKNWQGIKIPRGYKLTSVDSLSQETKLTPMQVRVALKKLQSTGEIKIETTNKYTLINLVKYNDCQDLQKNNKQNGRKITNKQQAVLLGNINDIENCKNKNNKQITSDITNEQQTNNNNVIQYNTINNHYILYGEFQNVKLSDQEHQKLIDEFGQDGTNAIIKILDTYKGSSGKKYKSDYLAIRNWVVDRYKQDQKKKSDNTSFLDL